MRAGEHSSPLPRQITHKPVGAFCERPWAIREAPALFIWAAVMGLYLFAKYPPQRTLRWVFCYLFFLLLAFCMAQLLHGAAAAATAAAAARPTCAFILYHAKDDKPDNGGECHAYKNARKCHNGVSFHPLRGHFKESSFSACSPFAAAGFVG